MFKNTNLIILLLLFSSNTFSADIIEGEGVVTRVVDGDTYWIKVDKKQVWMGITQQASSNNFRSKSNTFKARILNIDTEESVHRKKSKNTEFGKLSSILAIQELSGKKIHFSCNGVGKYKRPLCSVFLDGKDYAKSLVARGVSKYITRYGRHFNNHPGYVSSQLSARRDRLGLWGAGKEAYLKSLIAKNDEVTE